MASLRIHTGRHAQSVNSPKLESDGDPEDPQRKKRLCSPGVANRLKNHVKRLVWDFFTEPVHPVNLAVFRCWAFYLLHNLLRQKLDEKTAGLRGFSRDKFVPPFGYESFFHRIPISSALVESLKPVFSVACLFSSIGFCYELSAWVAVLLGSYLYFIPQCLGKIDHYHHIIWFPLVLAASPCAADVFSVDRLIARRRGHAKILSSSWIYGFPLKLMMLLLSIIYFFPGFHKIRRNGYDWIFGDYLRRILLQNYRNHPNFEPIFRLDEFPFLCRLGGIGAVGFEIFFPVIVLYPRLRPLLAVIGVSFHVGIWLMMNINILSLTYLYAIFVDWQWLFEMPKLPVQKSPVKSMWKSILLCTVWFPLLVGCGFCRYDSYLLMTIYPTFSGGRPKFHTFYVDDGKGEKQVSKEQLVGAFQSDAQAIAFQSLVYVSKEAEFFERCLSLRELLKPQISSLHLNSTKLSFYQDKPGQPSLQWTVIVEC